MPPTGADSPDRRGADSTFSGKNLDLTAAQPAGEVLADVATSPKTLEQLKAEYLQGHEVPKGEIVRFDLQDGYVAYNPSHVVQQTIGGEIVDCIAARIERVGEELSSSVKIFRKTTGPDGDTWVGLGDESSQLFQSRERTEADEADKLVLIREADKGKEADIPFGPVSYQDPAIAVGKPGSAEFIVVAVVNAQEQHRVDTALDERRSEYHQEFWAGPRIDGLEKIADGPKSRKGTRLVYLGSNKWGVFNRPQSPQGQQFGPGRITYDEFEASTTEEFNRGMQSVIESVGTVVPGLCTDDQWVGPNQGWPLEDGRIGMVGHIARMIDARTGVREYCGFSFIYDPATNTTQEVQIIATKASFQTVSPRPDRQDLNDVIYPGGANEVSPGKLRLYCGVSDNAAGYVDIDDPFAGRRRV